MCEYELYTKNKCIIKFSMFVGRYSAMYHPLDARIKGDHKCPSQVPT